MPRLTNIHGARRRRSAAMLFAAVAGFATAALVGVAIAKTFTLQVAKNAKVTNTIGMTTRENIVVNSGSHAIYDLTGDSKNHPECTKAKGCFQFWPPITVSSARQLSKALGIKGKLGIWHRNGFLQVTLAGHPLYRFAPDTRKHAATGEGIHSFGGTWHVVKVSASGTGSGTTTTTTPSTTTTTPSCRYPPCS
jgi:predicted lipoprotein with Yx(FWY)xxD motif